MADGLTRALPSSGYQTSAGLFGTTIDTQVTVPDLRLGELPARSVEVLLASQHSEGARNLLGMDVLGDHRCHFRFLDRPRTLHLSTAATASPVAGDEALMIGPHGQPFVSVAWPDGTTALALWDSGAGITVVGAAFHEKYPQLFEAVGDAVGTDSTGMKMNVPTCHVAAARTGASPSLSTSPRSSTSPPPTSLMGRGPTSSSAFPR